MNDPVPDDLSAAVRLHQDGHLERASRAYERILENNPEDAEALHLLGVVALQCNNPSRAIELIQRALALNPDAATFHCNLAEAYRAAGELDNAISSCRTALTLQPHNPETHNNLGLALRGLGRGAEAIAHLREAIRLQPAFALAHSNLGTALRDEGDLEQAATHFRQAVMIDPHLAMAHSNLGQVLVELKRPDEAVVHCRAATRLQKDFSEAHNNLGNALRELGQLTDAKAAYAEALRLSPGQALTYSNMGQALQEEGNLPEAVAWYQKALALDAHIPLVHSHLASALGEQECYEEAQSRYAIALSLNPELAEARNGLGFILHEQGDHDQAFAHFQGALTSKPDCAPAHCNFGVLLVELGRFPEAEAAFRSALHHDPRHTAALAHLATLLRGRLPEPDCDRLRRLLADPTVTGPSRSALHFGLAQVLDAQGQHAQAADHLRHANALRLAAARQQGKVYEPAEHRLFVDRLIDTFTPDLFARTTGFGLDTERPLFIFGLPRSGTTLIEQILASHSKVHGGGGLRLARQSFESLARVAPGTDNLSQCVAALDRDTVARLAHAHLDRLDRLNGAALRVVDKMPDNYLYLGLIALLFPRARMIHCRRDLRDVAVSCWMTNFRQIRWANDLDHLAARFADYVRLMSHWRRALPVPVLEVSYEETVRDLEGVARRLVAWAGLPWEPECLDFHETPRPVRTASVTQVRQPIYSRSVARWKNYENELRALFDRLIANRSD